MPEVGMKYGDNRRQTRVILFGPEEAQWRLQRGLIKGGMQSMHMAWTVLIDASADLDDALQRIRYGEDLEVFVICQGALASRTQHQFLADVTKLAGAISQHPHKPWVCVQLADDILDEVCGIIHSYDLTATDGDTCAAIHARWEQQQGLVAA